MENGIHEMHLLITHHAVGRVPDRDSSLRLLLAMPDCTAGLSDHPFKRRKGVGDALQGNPGIVPDKLRQDWKSTVLANWKLWVPCQFVNFRFVPQQLQVCQSSYQATLFRGVDTKLA